MFLNQPNPTVRNRKLALFAAVLTASPSLSHAAQLALTWGNADATNTWQDTANWTGGSGVLPSNAGGTTYVAQFGSAGISANSFIDVAGSATIDRLQITFGSGTNLSNAPNFTLGNSAAGGALTLTGGGAVSAITIGANSTGTQIISTNLILAPTSTSTASLAITKTGGGSLTITGNIGDNSATTGVAVGLLKNGGNALTVSGLNTYGGATVIEQNTLFVGANALSGVAGALGSGTSAVQLGDSTTTAAKAVSLLTVGGAFTVGRDIVVNNFGSTGNAIIGGSTNDKSTFTGAITLNRDIQLQATATGTNVVDFQGVISNGTASAGIIKTSAGIAQLSNPNNSYTGNTIVRNGTLVVAGDAPLSGNSVLGNSNSAILLSDSGSANNNVSLLVNGSHTIYRDINIANATSTGSVTIGGNSNANIAFTGTLSLSRGIVVPSTSTGTNVVDFQGQLTGAGGVIKSSGGAIRLDNAANNYAGVTTIRNGTLILNGNAPVGAPGVLGNATSAINFGDGSAANGATPSLLTSGNFNVGRDLSIYTGTNITSATVGGQIGNTAGSTFSGALNLAGVAAVRLQSYAATGNAVQFSGPISGNNAIHTLGNGAVILNASAGNSYTGPTVVGEDALAGELLINTVNSGGGSYSVQSGILGGTGSIVTGTGANGVTVGSGATLAPGWQSSGTPTASTLTLTGDVNLNGTLLVALDGATSGKLSDAGNLAIGSSSVLDLDPVSGLTASAYVIANYTTLSGAWDPSNIINAPAGYALDYAYNGNSIALVATSTPEPAGFALLALVVPALLGRRARRNAIASS